MKPECQLHAAVLHAGYGQARQVVSRLRRHQTRDARPVDRGLENLTLPAPRFAGFRSFLPGGSTERYFLTHRNHDPAPHLWREVRFLDQPCHRREHNTVPVFALKSEL